MTAQQIQTERKANPNFVPPITERQIGWLAYAEKLPIDTCGTDDMRRGWLKAWRDSANADAGTVFA
jgi:hypothetical protein